MKKIYSLMVAAVALFAAASCNKEISQEQLPVGETVVYTASVDGADTKAVLNETTKKSEWVANDAITVIDSEGKNWNFTTAASGQNVEFSNKEDFGDYRPVLAVYPKGTYTANIAEKTVNAYIPTFQGAREGTYNESAALAVAYSEGSDFAFKNAHALLKFTVKGEKSIKAIEFLGNNNEAITGNMLVALNPDNTVKSVDGQMTEFTEGQETTTKKGTWVKFYSEDTANEWCFKEGVTYYVAIAPANFTKGVSVNFILKDDSMIKAAKKTDNPVVLAPNTILNLGEFEYVKPGTGTSGWSLPGGYNGWSTTTTFLSEEGDYYVAKNVSGLNAGFKFHHEEFGWKGVGSLDPLAPGQWHKLGGNADISLTDANAYDIYMTKDGTQFQAVSAGSAVPEAPVVVADYWGLIGSMAGSAWGTDLVLKEEGDYLVVKGVALKTTDEFKFRKNGLWDEQKIVEGGMAQPNTEHNLMDAGMSNMKIGTAGTYDVFVTKDLKKVYFMTSGKTPDQAGQAQTQTVEIYANTNHSKLWAWLPTVGNLNLTGGNWPGYSSTTVSKTYNGVTYTKKWTLNVPTEHMGKNLMVIFSGSGNQTADSGPYVLSNNMYFVVDGSNKVSQNK